MFILSGHLVYMKFLCLHIILVIFDGCHIPLYTFHVLAKWSLSIICLFFSGLHPIFIPIAHGDSFFPYGSQPHPLLKKAFEPSLSLS